MVEQLKRVKMRRCAKFGRNRSKCGGDMTIFRFLKMAAAAILDYLNFKLLTVGRLEGRIASPWQIYLKSVEMRRRYDDFSIFQDGGRRHLAFLNFWSFNGRTAQEGQNAPLCQIWSKSVKMWRRYDDFSIFQHGGHPLSWIYKSSKF